MPNIDYTISHPIYVDMVSQLSELKKVRHDVGLTVEEISEVSGVKTSDVHAFEDGKIGPHDERFQCIVGAYSYYVDVDVEELARECRRRTKMYSLGPIRLDKPVVRPSLIHIILSLVLTISLCKTFNLRTENKNISNRIENFLISCII